MKRIFCFLLACLLAFSAAACASTGKQAEPTAAPVAPAPAAEPTAESVVAFNDPVLEEMIRTAMGIPEGDITVAQAEAVTTLNLEMDGNDWSKPRIADISALRYFTNLTSLRLGWALQNNGSGVDLAPLSGLIHLEALYINSNDVRSIHPLSSLTNLKDLRIFGCHELMDLSPISGMTKLIMLWAQGCGFVDVGSISDCKDLKQLYLADNLIYDISPLAGLTQLSEVTLSGNPILDYSPIVPLYPNLQNPDFDLDPDNDVIAIKDAVLEAAIRSAIQKPGGDVTFADVKDLTNFDANRDWEEKPAEGSQIQDITALKYFISLTSLGLQFHAIQNIRPLAGLTKLESLRLGGNPVNDLDALYGLTNLSELTLWNCTAGNYSKLERLTKLQSLEIGYSSFSDLNLLTGLHELRSLDIAVSKVTDASPLLNMPQLEKLMVRDCLFNDYAPLIQIYPNLKETDFDPNDSSIAAQMQFPSDEVIVFRDPVLERMVREAMKRPDGDITFADARAVKELRLNIDYQQEYPAGTRITSIEGLQYFVNLELLELHFHDISDISPLAGLVKLRSLALGGNPVNDIAAIANLKHLDFLSLFNCQASDYTPLKNLAELHLLLIGWSTFADASVLAGLTNLSDLDLVNSQVTDVAPLASLTNLRSLKLSGCAIADYQPLKPIYANLTDKDFEL